MEIEEYELVILISVPINNVFLQIKKLKGWQKEEMYLLLNNYNTILLKTNLN